MPSSQSTFEKTANDDARRAFAGPYLLQTLGNAARIAREGDAAMLTGRFAGTPAIIAAAGPSLDRNLHEIGTVRDRAILIACDTATRPLCAVGLEPDLVVAVDPTAANAAHLAGLQTKRAWLVGEGSLHPAALMPFEKRTFFFKVSDHQPWPWLQTLNLDRGLLEVWGSVVTAAIDLAIRMGCSPIVVAGADLAFTGNRPYCRGTTFESQWGTWIGGGETYERIWQQSVQKWTAAEEVDVAGAPARTAPHLVAFRNWIVERAGRDERVRLVNGTGAGILHGGRIALRPIYHTLYKAPQIDCRQVGAMLRSLHSATPDSRPALFEHITALLGNRAQAFVNDWIAFSGKTIDFTDIATALGGLEYSAWLLGARRSETRRT